MKAVRVNRLVLPAIIISQFFCTSLWFAGNAVSGDIIREFNLESGFVSYLTSAVQLGFITGTFLFAIFNISDRFSPSAVFLVSSILAAIVNAGQGLNDVHPDGLLLCRFLTGFFLAGVYPVGMKIASDYYQQGLGKSMGFLVGALVLGTSFPHLLKTLTAETPWKYLIYVTSGLSVAGGCIISLFVPDGPFRKPAQRLQIKALFAGFRNIQFRSAAFGYFGHMWELYTFWTFLPFLLNAYKAFYQPENFNVPLISFLVIAAGGISCAIGGSLSPRFGTKRIATIALFSSGACCLLSPLIFSSGFVPLLIPFLLFWGMAATADSPLFSTLVAQAAPAETRGTALTMVTCIGFAITIVSIQLMSLLGARLDADYLFVILAVGPVLGLMALMRRTR